MSDPITHLALELRKLKEQRDAELLATYNRSLPLLMLNLIAGNAQRLWALATRRAFMIQALSLVM